MHVCTIQISTGQQITIKYMISYELSSLAINCGMLGNPINGDVITNGTVLGSLASYSCRAGYELEGDATRVCQPNRSWSNTEPTCLGRLHQKDNYCPWLRI
jgi:hypothetical protein